MLSTNIAHQRWKKWLWNRIQKKVPKGELTHWLLLGQSLEEYVKQNLKQYFRIAKLSINAEGAEAERISGTQSSEH